MAVNVNPNPDLDLNCLFTPLKFSNRTSLGFVHLNVCSLVPKLGYVSNLSKCNQGRDLGFCMTPGSKRQLQIMIFQSMDTVYGYKM